jgi:hypothetical protein
MPVNGQHQRTRRARLRIADFFAQLGQTAEQLTDLDRLYRILSYALVTSRVASSIRRVASSTTVFAAPVPILANTTYLAAYYAPSGQYAYTTDGPADSVTNPPLTLTAPASWTVGGSMLLLRLLRGNRLC